ncbi:Nicotinate-nucleotide pyrophosphorylase [Nitrobacter sp. Nb-311A]|uniref:carboxylating nicotinate-nucleotide diphosphorylase n=1 Tax=unclassified Nitrobacter TaxID=2620411 RepID=UPI0000687A66|nr:MULTISPECIES: carboxylating nicotinate-nucleotide diphosphorylase [unclassified Nitrobacter]EAQ36329.1 Nicotinate-nucleotide pyrophosphorylase [Nitrobacter sp. Nb-311A]MCB1394369.1 carboxylating nicotinate-nucleotide diphosphorylase [Nitrobacter sp.]MCV0387620.1 carboxylating nicotinate-nucleotide diphosphorylase [Nitrobacter sp.]
MPLPALPRIMIEPLVRMALLEDVGRAGDLTTDAIVPVGHRATILIVARQHGTVAGLELARLAFELLDPAIQMHAEHEDGATVEPGEVIATLSGRARGILTAERVALNFLCRLSGIATATASIVAAVQGHGTKIVCTRKTTPGLRAVEKYAVRAGGGSNHRFGLDDAVLIKDNHIAIAGSVTEALKRAKNSVGHLVKIELEVDTLDQLREALDQGVDAVLLDNMSADMLREAVAMARGRTVTEASGRITPATATEIALTGVDLISIGWLTHSVGILDFGLDFKDQTSA